MPDDFGYLLEPEETEDSKGGITKWSCVTFKREADNVRDALAQIRNNKIEETQLVREGSSAYAVTSQLGRAINGAVQTVYRTSCESPEQIELRELRHRIEALELKLRPWYVRMWQLIKRTMHYIDPRPEWGGPM